MIGARQLVAQQILDHLDEPFADLQRDVAGEPVADDHVGRSAVDVARLDVADERERRRLQQPVRLARQLVALGFLFADRQQRRPAARSMPNATRAYMLPITANCSRCCGRHSTLAPTSSSTAGRAGSGSSPPSAGRSTPGQHAERAVRRHHRRAGVAGAEQRRGLARARPIRPRPGSTRPACGAAPPPAARPSPRPRRRATIRTRVGVDVRMPREFVFESRTGPTSVTPRSKCRAAASAPSTMCPRRVVAAHRVDGDPDHGGNRRLLAVERGRCQGSRPYSSLTARTCRPR